MWLERPLSEPLGEHLARKVMFLRELRLEQLDMILVDLKQITEVYLGVLRDKDSLTVSQVSHWDVIFNDTNFLKKIGSGNCEFSWLTKRVNVRGSHHSE